MTDASVAADLNESLDIKSDITSEVTLYTAVVVNVLSELGDIFLGQVSDAGIRINSCCCEDIVRSLAADTENISKADLHSFISG